MRRQKLLLSIASTIISASLAFSSCPLYSNAVDSSISENEYYIDLAEIELPVSKTNEEWVTVIYYYDEASDSIKHCRYEDIDSIPDLSRVVFSFSGGLAFNTVQNKFNLNWEVHCAQLTAVSGSMYCCNFSYPATYYDSESIYQSYPGTYNIGYGSGSNYFSIPSSVSSVKVGWQNIYISSISDTYSVSNGYITCYPNSLKP